MTSAMAIEYTMLMVILLISVTLLVSISQTILYAWNTPPGTVFPLVHNFIEDYYQYLDIMRQGYDGWWVATSRLTPEAYPRMVVSVFLLTLGHIARVLHVSLPAAYTGARVGGGIVLMTLVYQFIRITFPQSFFRRLTALCFVLFGTSVWGWGPDGPAVAPLTHAWTELDPILRWTFVPHHLWAKIGMVGTFIFLLGRRRSFILNSLFFILIVFMGFTNPVVYATFVPTLLIYMVLTAWRQSRLSFESIMPAVAIVVSGGVLLYHRYLQTNIFPWTSYLLWEQTLLYKVNPFDYAVSLGPTLVLFVLAIPTIWRLGRVGSLYLAWAGSSWFMLYVAGPFLPITPERFLGGYQFIPLGIGAAEGVWILASQGIALRSYFSPRPSLAFARGGLMKFVLVSAFLLYSAIGLSASLREHAGYVAANSNNPQVYVPKDLMAALGYLSQNGNAEDVVMAPYEISTMIPAFTGKRVVAGHVLFTKDVATKRSRITEFFATRDPSAASRIASLYMVRWVLSNASWIPPQGIHLTKRFSSKSYTLYFWQ